MAESSLDTDLRSVHEARTLARRASAAQSKLEDFSQERIDAVVEAMAEAGLRESARLGRQAHEETGFGNPRDKKAKNDFVLRDVVEAMRGMRTVGVIAEHPERRVVEIAEPVGMVAGIIPSTNPTSTAMFKCLIALKARCGIVLSPHPAAVDCILACAEVMHRAAVEAGAPEAIIGCMSHVTMDGTEELMGGRDTDLILATGGMGLVRAAYSAGKPAYGVGPGNVPAYIERSADVAQAIGDIFSGTTFDYGTLCSSEQSIVCDRAIRDRVLEQIEAQGGRMLDPDEVERLSPVVITEDYLVDPEVVGRPAPEIADKAGIDVDDDTRVLVCPLEGVGKEYPLSHEKLSPVLAYYEVEDWREGCERCKELLGFGGMGHTLAIHSRDEEVIRQFGLHKPAHRVLANTVAAVGAVGLTTDLFPSMTLGCGSWGNNITSDNIGPQHLVDVKRLAYGVRPFRSSVMEGSTRAARPAEKGEEAGEGSLESRIGAFLKERGVGGTSPSPTPERVDDGLPASGAEAGTASDPPDRSPAPPRGNTSLEAGDKGTDPGKTVAGARETSAPADFVSETDVRDAIRRGETIRVGRDTIVTPLARELGEQHEVFTR